ncbi:MAG: prepilin-type N-terminal cleavage/methylation domain-containing protein [Desulfobulbaceae bacterium]|nr:prepilin-type N-terminal cleavage/methylation domain-containing protein [Desulfobulbaceae bacterium]HIJ90815.1 prepilin-type N-terminal cleavage/methylation domain-containing protein [Deltaproteobacteria bacterium]
MSNNKQQSQGQQGFTLVEIMIALLVFMVVMLGVAGGLITAIQANRGNVVRDEALRLAEDELNRLKGIQFSVFATSAELTATVPPAWTAPTNVLSNIRGGTVTFARARQITDLATAATALKRVDVAVGWNEPGPSGGTALPATGMNRQVSLSTIIVRSN